MRLKNTIVLVLILQCIEIISLAQNFETSYSTGRNDQARAITQTQDSGYAVIGSTVTYEGNTDMYLLKTDAQGTFLWAKRFGDLGMESGQDIVETTDSGLAILGYGHNNGVYDMLFIKTDKNGNQLIKKFIGEVDWDFGNALKQTPDKGYILAGETYLNGDSKGYLVKLDSNGNTKWKKSFGGTLTSKFDDIIIARNGDFVMAGETEAFGNGKQVYVVRTDSSGTLIWEKNYGNPGTDFARSITQISTGEFVFAGATNKPPYSDLDNWAVKIDSLGNLIQNQIVIDYSPTPPSTQNDDWNETVVVHNDSLIFAGQRSYDAGEPGNVFIYRYSNDISTSGYLNDYQKYLSPDTETVYDSKATFDGGVIFACSAEFMDTTSESSIYLIKMDSNMTYPHPYFNSISNQNDYTSLAKKEQNLDFSIYPNPSSQYFNINLEKFKNEKVTVTIFDLQGNLILKDETSDLNYLVESYSYNAGVYFVTLQSKQVILTKKVIVSK